MNYVYLCTQLNESQRKSSEWWQVDWSSQLDQTYESTNLTRWDSSYQIQMSLWTVWDAEVRDSNIQKYEFNEVRLIVSNTDELVDSMRDAEVRDSNTDEWVMEPEYWVQVGSLLNKHWQIMFNLTRSLNFFKFLFITCRLPPLSFSFCLSLSCLYLIQQWLKKLLVFDTILLVFDTANLTLSHLGRCFLVSFLASESLPVLPVLSLSSVSYFFSFWPPKQSFNGYVHLSY